MFRIFFTRVIAKKFRLLFNLPSSLSVLGCRSEKSSDRGQILPDLQRQYPDIDQEAGEICTDQIILQPATPKSDRLLVIFLYRENRYG